MDGYEPITKSFLADIEKCAYRAMRIKVDRVKGPETPASRLGKILHHLTADIRTGMTTFDQAIATAKKLPHEEDREEVVELVSKAVTTDPVVLSDSERKTQKIEHYFLVDKNGKKVKSKKKGILHGYIDRMFRRDDGVVVVDDLKGGHQYYEDQSERFCYVLGAKAEWPDATEIHFAYQYVRLNYYPTWKHLFSDGDKVLQVIGPDGAKANYNVGENYLLHWIHMEDKKLREMEPIPTAGPWCERYYGVPCHFFGTECPLAQDVPTVIDATLPKTDDAPAIQLLKRVIANDQLLEQDDISRAYGGLLQLQAFVKSVEKGVKDWSSRNGTFVVGQTSYGWFTAPENVVDKEFALKEMLNEMEIEDVVKALSISKSSLERISKRKYGDFREGLIAFAVSEGTSKPKFGKIDNPAPADEV